MNEQLLQENKEKLLTEQTKLRTMLEGMGKFDGKGEFPGDYKPNFPQFGDEEGEDANEVEVYDQNIGVTRDLEQRLSNVEAALKRIEEGTYGKCVEGDEIEEGRLRAVPEADRCMKHSK